jgi:hypothetical protein
MNINFNSFSFILFSIAFVNFLSCSDGGDIGVIFSSVNDKKEPEVVCFTDNLQESEVKKFSIGGDSREKVNLLFVDEKCKKLFTLGFDIKESKAKDKNGKDCIVKEFVLNKFVNLIDPKNKSFDSKKIKDIVQQALALKICKDGVVKVGYGIRKVKLFLNQIGLIPNLPWYKFYPLVKIEIPLVKETKLKLVDFKKK